MSAFATILNCLLDSIRIKYDRQGLEISIDDEEVSNIIRGLFCGIFGFEDVTVT